MFTKEKPSTVELRVLQLDFQRDVESLKARMESTLTQVNAAIKDFNTHVSYIHNRVDNMHHALTEIRDMARDSKK